MPGDLKDPEASPVSQHFDSTYEPGTNPHDTRPLSIEQILQAAAKSFTGKSLNKEQMAEAQSFLKSKHLLNRNPGDQEVQEAIEGYFKTKKSARKVARTWLTLTND